jgi:hypothetical protein
VPSEVVRRLRLGDTDRGEYTPVCLEIPRLEGPILVAKLVERWKGGAVCSAAPSAARKKIIRPKGVERNIKLHLIGD